MTMKTVKLAIEITEPVQKMLARLVRTGFYGGSEEEAGSAPPPIDPIEAQYHAWVAARAVPRGEPSPNATALAERFLADKTVWPLGCNLVAQRVTRGFAVWLDAQAVDRLPAEAPEPIVNAEWLGDENRRLRSLLDRVTDAASELLQVTTFPEHAKRNEAVLRREVTAASRVLADYALGALPAGGEGT